MKKVLILCASPRKESNTMQVLEECAKTIEENGIETEIISIRQMKIRSCIACGKCSEIHECALNDGVNEIIEKIKRIRWLHCWIPSLLWNCTWRFDVRTAKDWNG